MKKFKDTNNQVHAIEEGFEYMLPAGCIEITDAEAVELVTPPEKTPQEIEDMQIAQVEAELGSNAIRIIIETIVPMIQDGSIASKTPDEIIITAKANRKAEL